MPWGSATGPEHSIRHAAPADSAYRYLRLGRKNQLEHNNPADWSIKCLRHFGRYWYTAAGNPNRMILVPLSHSGPTTSR